MIENKFQQISKYFTHLSEQSAPDDDPNWQKRQDRLTPGKNPEEFYGPGSFFDKMKNQGTKNIPDRDTSGDTRSGEFNVDVLIGGRKTKVNVKYGHATGPVDDVTISWGNESHNVDFEDEDVIDDHGNEGKDMVFMAMSDNKQWIFMVDVSVGFNYEDSGEIQDVDWGTLEIDQADQDKIS